VKVSAQVSRRSCAGSLVVLCLVGGIGACGESRNSDARRSNASQTSPSLNNVAPSPREPRAYRVVVHEERQQLSNFALLRTRPEGLPLGVRRVLRAPVFGLNWKLAQRIPSTLRGTYWLVPGNGYLCVIAQGSMGSPETGTTCAPTSQAVENGVADVTIARAAPGSRVRPGRLIVGVAPNGARQVVFHTRGTVEAAPVVDDVFVLRDAIAAPPDSFTAR
jgi:hypothetical protein